MHARSRFVVRMLSVSYLSLILHPVIQCHSMLNNASQSIPLFNKCNTNIMHSIGHQKDIGFIYYNFFSVSLNYFTTKSLTV